MPDFGIQEALEAALKASKSVPVMRPAERTLAEQAAAKATPGAAAPVAPPVVARAPSVQTPPAEPASPTSVTAPPLDPSRPPAAVPPPAAADAVGSPEATPGAPEQAPAPAAAAALPETPGVTPAPPPEPIAPGNRIGAQPAPEVIQTSAQRFVRANLGDFGDRLDMTHMPNTNTMVVPDQLKASILQVADDNQALIESARGGVVSDQQLTAMAQDLAVNKDVLVQKLAQEFGDPVKRPAIALGARAVEMQNLGELYELAGKVADGSASSTEVTRYVQAEQVFAQYRAMLAGVAAESGRLQRAFGIPVGLPSEVADHVASVIQQANPDLRARASAIRLAGTPQGISSIINGMATIPLSRRLVGAASGLIQRIYINGILSGPPTWATILVGNNTNLIGNTADLYAAGIGRGMYGLAARIGGWPTAAEGATLSDAIAYTHGVLASFGDAFRVFGRVMRTGVSMDNVGKPASRAGENFNNWGRMKTGDIFAPELNRNPLLDATLGRVIRFVDNVIDFPGSRMIGALDDFTKTMAFRGYSTMMSLKEIRARLTAGTLKPGDAEQVMLDMMKNQTPEMQQASEAWAHRITFQTPWPEGGPGEAAARLLDKAPMLRFIFPFMRTATNIFKQSVGERSPLAGFSARLRNQLAAGGFEGDLAKARIATGVGLASMVAMMAVHDRVTGAAPKDAKERALWELDGRKEYSIRVTNPMTGEDSWHEYQKFEPFASIVGTTADAAQVWSYINQDDIYTMRDHEARMQDIAGHIVASVIQNTGDKTFMQGAAKFAEVYNDPQRALGMWTDEFGASLVPYSGALKFVRNEQDPYLREAYTLIDKIRDELPTFLNIRGSMTLPARPDVFGDPRPTYSGNAILGPLNPFPGNPSKRSALTDEIQDVAERTRTTPVTMPSKQISFANGMDSGKGMQDGTGMHLTPEEYAEYVHYARATPIFDGGKRSFAEELQRVIDLPVYQTSTPPERSAMLGNVQHTADKIGAALLYKNNSDFQQRLLEWTADKNRLKFNK